jgi:hypothetical protein
MKYGTACNKLRKLILFTLVKETKRNICYQCKKEITSIDDFTIEHKIPWLDSLEPKKLFFSIDNIGFSHYKCNIRVARKINKKYATRNQRVRESSKRIRDRIRKTNPELLRQIRREQYRRTGN